LLDQGHTVTCIDNFLTGSRRNLTSILSHPGFHLLEHEVGKPFGADLQPADLQPADLQPDLIFHLASPASVPDYLSHPIETLCVNSLGTMQMLDLARRTGARFLFTSTSEIYGDPLVHPQAESYWGNVNPNGPRACYDESKRFGEAVTMEYWRSYGVDARLVRIFNTYGPHSRPDDGRIVPNFIIQALRHEPLTVYGDGSQTRSFCYVSDLVDGILAAMQREGTTGEVFNLGNPDEYTVLEFAQIILGRVGRSYGGADGKVDIVYQPLPVDDPTRRRPDITKAQETLGWQPRVGLDEGIDRTASWFREILQLPVG
jgi:nucleoside-diphosphate-sugar epimerase